MITLSLVAGVVVVVAAAIAVTAADGRLVALALFAAIAASPLAASPVPGALEIAARVVAATLAAYVLWIVMKGGAVRSEGSAIGVAAELAVAAAAYVLGWWVQPVSPLQGPLAEQAAGFSLVALAALPLAGSNVLRAGVGVMLLVLGASLVMETWLGPAPALAQLVLTALLLVIPSAVALLVDVDDEIAKVVPAVEKTRDETPAPEGLAAAGLPARGVGAPGAEGASTESTSPDEEAAAAAPGFLAARGRQRGSKSARSNAASAGGLPSARPAASAPEAPEPEPGTETTPRQPGQLGPRPSIRFLGRSAAVRGADRGKVEPQAGRSGARPGAEGDAERDVERGSERGSERGRPFKYTRRLGGEYAIDEEPSAREDATQPQSEPESGAGRKDDRAGLRGGRDLRNPRFKRPLR